MTEPQLPEESIFLAALEIESAAERAAFLNQACGNDAPLRAGVEALLRASDKSGDLLDVSWRPDVHTSAATSDQPPAERLGTTIGPYKLLQVIGEGGMGTVYMAEQTVPVERKVALKVIKAGMDTQQVIARFEAERQALAMMDHVNIARVLDVGTTSAGRPFFVMELVHGVPITKYCDDNHLTPRQRLELFVPVCQAIQHAHQKGIIHRDIKPSNVMVTHYESKPVPKVIDFGVAKATEQKLTERTLFTQYGTMVGTLEYMSPEQAEMSGMGVDTRSDIYSLGVLLYELLTGSTPLSSKRMKAAAYAEILRLIKEEEPPKPSTRLSDSGEALASISAQRLMEPAKLTRMMRGELDWIVMKTLEKDRNRRYESASGFAADVQRYLNDEPVQACPPSAWYRFRKFSRRNRAALLGTSLVAVALLVAVVGVTGAIGWALRDRAAREAELARDRARRQTKIAGQVELILDQVERLALAQRWQEALAAGQRAEAALASDAADAATSNRVSQVLADLEMVGRLEDIRLSKNEVSEQDQSFDSADNARRYAAAFRNYGADVEALPASQVTQWLRSHALVVIPLAAALDDWGQCCRSTREERLAKDLWSLAGAIDPDPWRLHVRQVVATGDLTGLASLAEFTDTARQPPQSQLLLAGALRRANQHGAAIELLERASRTHSADFWIHYELAALSVTQRPKRVEAASRHFTAACALRPNSAVTWSNLAFTLCLHGNFDEAIACCRQAIEADPKCDAAHNNLGLALNRQGKLDEAIAHFRKAIELDPKSGVAHYNLGMDLAKQKKLDEASACYRTVIELKPTHAPAHNHLGVILYDQKKLEEAAACFRKAIELDPTDPMPQCNLGAALKAQGNLDGAIACYRRAVVIDPKFAGAHFSLGLALANQKKPDEAIACFSQAVQLQPNNSEYHDSLGVVLRITGRREEALASFRAAVRLKPDNATALVNLGLLLANNNGEADEVLALLRRASQLNPEIYEVQVGLGAILSNDKGDYDGAITAFREAIRLRPRACLAHVNLGITLDRKGLYAQAVAAYREALRLSPEEASAQNSLVELLASCPDPSFRDPAQALQLARHSVKLHGQSAYAWQLLGWANYRTGDWQASIEALNRSIQIQNGGGDIDQWFFLAMAHWRLGEKDQARAWYDRAVAWMDQNEKTLQKSSHVKERGDRLRAEAAELIEIGRKNEP